MTGPSPAPLAEKADIVRGVTFSKADAVGEPRDGYSPVLRAGNIQGQLILDHGLVFVPENKISEKQRLRCGDIVMCTSSGSTEIVGKTAYSEKDWDGSFGAFCAVVRPKEGQCHPRYLFHYLQSPKFRDWTRNSSGAGIKNIRKSELDAVEIPFPNIDEQRRIARILDKAEAIRRKREQALELADEFLKSVFLEMFGDPRSNPKGWNEIPLGQLLERIDSGHSPRCHSHPAVENELGVLKVSAISSTKFHPHKNKATFEGYKPKPLSLVRKGDLLFSRKNTYLLVGASAIVLEDVNNLTLPDLIFRLVPFNEGGLQIPFLWGLLTQASMRDRIRELAGGAAASMPNIGKAQLKEMLIPVPDNNTQKKFTTVFSKHHNHIWKLRSDSEQAESIFLALSQRAFAGKL